MSLTDIFLYNLFLLSRDSSEDTTQYHRLLDKNVSTKEMLTFIYDQIVSKYLCQGLKTALFVLNLVIFVFNCRFTLYVPIWSVWVKCQFSVTITSLWNPELCMVKVTQPWIRRCFHMCKQETVSLKWAACFSRTHPFLKTEVRLFCEKCHWFKFELI